MLYTNNYTPNHSAFLSLQNVPQSLLNHIFCFKYWLNLHSGALQWRPESYLKVTNRGKMQTVYRLHLSFKDCSELKLWAKLLSLLFQASTSTSTSYISSFCAVVVDVWWLAFMEWLMLKQELRLGRTRLICTNPPARSVSQVIRSDWCFVMVAGSVSISFAYLPPHPAPSAPAHPFASLPHCRVIRTATLYERGDDKRIYTQSLTEE